jgi:hypothetical protein
MKLSDGAYAVQMLYRMLKLLMILTRGKSHVYIHSIMMQLMVLKHQRNNDTAAWRMLMGSLSTFNEEAGEISFGMLARCILGDTQKGKFAHLNKLYQQIHFYGQLESELGAEGAGFSKNGNWRKKVDPDGELVQTVATFVNQLVRQIRMETFKVYSGKPATYKLCGPAIKNLVSVSNPVPLWLPDILSVLDAQFEKCKQKFATFFVEPYSDIWPECRHHPEMPLLQRQDQLREVIQARRKNREIKQNAIAAEIEVMLDLENKHLDEEVPRSEFSNERSPRKKRRCQLVNSEDDSEESCSASSDSDPGEDAVPEPSDSNDRNASSSQVYHAGWADIDPSNIMNEMPGERRRKIARAKKK